MSNVLVTYFPSVSFVQFVNCCRVFPAWREESCSAESRLEETKPSLRKVRPDGGMGGVTSHSQYSQYRRHKIFHFLPV